jgi:hypothetical protein
MNEKAICRAYGFRVDIKDHKIAFCARPSPGIYPHWTKGFAMRPNYGASILYGLVCWVLGGFLFWNHFGVGSDGYQT